MGGQILLDSDPGKGSIFHFAVRFQPASETIPVPFRGELSRLRDMPVLVVDDNSINRRMMEQSVKGWEMKVTLVDGAVAALDAIGRACTAGFPFRLILMDVQMPGFDGFELARRIRENPTLNGTILIMLSSIDQQVEINRCRELGIHRYLIKPVFQAELLSAILEAMAVESGSGKTAELRSTLSQRSESSLRILVAEDNPVNQKVDVSVLQERGHIVIVAPDSKRAVEVLERETFDLVLMDIQMPEMNGYEATFEIGRAS